VALGSIRVERWSGSSLPQDGPSRARSGVRICPIFLPAGVAPPERHLNQNRTRLSRTARWCDSRV